MMVLGLFFFQAEDGIRDLVRSRGLGDVYKRQASGAGLCAAHVAHRGAHAHITPGLPGTRRPAHSLSLIHI